MDLQLKGQVALVTGGTKGIGRAIAETFASEGCNVAICARKEDEVKAAVAALQKKGVKAFGEGGRRRQRRSAESVDQRIGRSAGRHRHPRFQRERRQRARRSRLAFELRARHAGCGAQRRSVVALSVEVEERQHVMISTTAALEKFISAGPYNAMKAALLNYSGALSQDLAAKGIRVNAVSPGPIMIEGGAWDMIKKGMAPFYEATLAQVPMGTHGYRGRSGGAGRVPDEPALRLHHRHERRHRRRHHEADPVLTSQGPVPRYQSSP
jgi:3-oxoacyl-[acyl-carrier protein] reductase